MAGKSRRLDTPTATGLPVATLKPPKGLSESMTEAWKTIVQDLADQGTLERTDRVLIEAAAVMWGRARDARGIIDTEGYRSATVRGTWTANPMIAVERESWKELRMLSDQLPLTRAARKRLGLADKKEQIDPFAPPAPLRSVK